MLNVSINSKLGSLDMHLEFAVPSRGVTAIFGRSGAGKSTLINYIAGIISPDNARITLQDKVLTDTVTQEVLPAEKRKIGYVFQDARLFPHYTVAGNLNYGRPSQQKNDDQYQHIVNLLDLRDLLQRYPTHLSGGEKQRVAIGRALLSQPELLLMDEPLASLDTPRKQELIPYLNRLAKEINIPILYVSHSLEEVIQLADQMLLLDKGIILQAGSVESVWSSSEMSPWLQGDSRSSLFKATLSHHHEAYAMSCVQISDDHHLWVRHLNTPVGAQLRFRVRANEVSLVKQKPDYSSIRNILPVTVKRVIPADEESMEVELNVGGVTLWSHITRWAADDLGLAKGDSIFAQIKGVSVTHDDWSDR